MITITIQDSEDTMTFTAMITSPINYAPVITETDVQTIDGNISTYYGSTKRNYEIEIGWMDSDEYARLVAFRDRQYANLKYPQVTITGDQNLNVTSMVAKLTLGTQYTVDQCGLVEDISITLRESKQMP